MKKEDFIFCPLGGSGEIGMNMNLFAYGNLENRYWAGDDFAIAAPSRTWETILLHLPESAFFSTFSDKYPKIVADYNDHFTVNLNSLRANNTQKISQNLTLLASELYSTENRTRYETDL